MDIHIGHEQVSMDLLPKTKNISKDFKAFMEKFYDRSCDENILVIESHGYDDCLLLDPKTKIPLKYLMTNKSFDAILLDACCMSSLNTIVTLHPFTKYLVASQWTVPYLGILTSNFIKIISDDRISLPTRLKAVADSYIQRNSDNDPKWKHLRGDADISVIDMSKVPDFLLNFDDQDKRPIAKYRIIKYPEYMFYDLYSYMPKHQRAILKDMVLYYKKTHKHPHTHGVSLSLSF